MTETISIGEISCLVAGCSSCSVGEWVDRYATMRVKEYLWERSQQEQPHHHHRDPFVTTPDYRTWVADCYGVSRREISVWIREGEPPP